MTENSNGGRNPLLPLPTGLEKWIMPKYLIDGICGIGPTWNFLSIGPIGLVKINLGALDLVTKPTEYKGITELMDYRQILKLELTKIHNVDIYLLVCLRQEPRLWKGCELVGFRRKVISAIEATFRLLPGFPVTNRDHSWRVGDFLTISGQNDWERVGELFENEFRRLMMSQAENDAGYLLTDGFDCLMYFERLGQERYLCPLAKHEGGDTIIMDMQNSYSFLRREHIKRLVIHFANDYILDSESQILVPNADYISKSCKLGSGEYYPILGIPGIGNVQHRFSSIVSTPVRALQVYQRWTNYASEDPYKLLREPYVAQRVFDIMLGRFRLNVQDGKEIVSKVRFKKDQLILEGGISTMVNGLLEVLQAGVEVRVEAVWSGVPDCSSEIGVLIWRAFRETEDWLKMHNLSYLRMKNFLLCLKKPDVMGWTDHVIKPCLSTINRIVKKANEMIHAEEVLDLNPESYTSGQEYLNIMASETILTYLLHGTLRERSRENLWNYQVKIFLGLKAENDLESNFQIPEQNVGFVDGYIHCNTAAPWRIPSWVKSPWLQYLKEIKTQLIHLENGEGSHSAAKNICRAILGFAMSYENEKSCRESSISFSATEFDLSYFYQNSLFGTNSQYTRRLDPYSRSTLYQLESSKQKGVKRKDSENSKKMENRKIESVVSVAEIVRIMLSSVESGKPVVFHIVEWVRRRLSVLNARPDDVNLNIESGLEQFIEQETIRQRLPLVFGRNQNSGFVSAFPFENASKFPPELVKELFINTYFWYRGEGRRQMVEKEVQYFTRIERLFDTENDSVRKTISVNDIFEISVLVVEGKITEAETILQRNGVGASYLLT